MSSRDYENYMLIRPDIYPSHRPKTICPVCHGDCEYVYKDIDGEVVGCDECLKRMDVDDYWEEQKAQYEE